MVERAPEIDFREFFLAYVESLVEGDIMEKLTPTAKAAPDYAFVSAAHAEYLFKDLSGPSRLVYRGIGKAW